LSDRLTEIEIKIAHIEQSLTELSDVLYQQQTLITRLESGFNELKGRVLDADKSTTGNSPDDEKPPHY
jgi:uncharacterized coiled-coil protein SlyX